MKNSGTLETAKRLLQIKNEVMERWEKLVRSEFTEAQKESKPHLIDSLPEFLDELVNSLTHAEVTNEDIAKIKKISQEHAEERAQATQFTIEHVLREYNILRKVIFEMLETEAPLDVASRDIVVNFLQAGQTNATCEFAEIVFDQERKMRQDLEEKEQVFKTIFELAAAGKAIVDMKTGRFLQVNRRFSQMVGYTDEELLEKTVVDLSHPDDRNNLIIHPPIKSDASDESEAWTIEKRYIAKDGTPVWAMISGAIFPAIDGKSPRVIATIFDITEKKQIEILKDQFVNTLTHDLRTPLSVIDMSGQLLQMKPEDKQLVLKLADRILANAKRCDSMIQDLLDTSRIRAGHSIQLDLEKCDLVQIVQESIEALSSLHGDRFIVSAPETVKGSWSRKGIIRIIENLCGNAIKYGAKNFPILVTISEVEDKVNLSINNRGEPIPKENMSTLFQQFSRTRSAVSSGKLGWGIGLTIVKGITEAHCGEISVQSNEHDGTTFTVSLPKNAGPCQEGRNEKSNL